MLIFQVRLVRSCPRSQQFEETLKETHSVYHKYQMTVHGDTPDKPSMKQFTRFLIDSPLEVCNSLIFSSLQHVYIL